MIPKPDSCKTCPGFRWGSKGFVPASGSGSNGVLIVAEAAGENEAQAGEPLVGKAGHYFWSQLQRVGLERDDFRIHNVLSCRPPENKLSKMPYELEVIQACRPNLDATIQAHVAGARASGKTPVILTLGRIAFKRLMGYDDKSPVLRLDYTSYPFWSQEYEAWVIPTYHPSYLMRGYHHLVPVMQFAAKRAVEIASEGLELETPTYLLDPSPWTFDEWAKGYLGAADSVTLSYDIETPYKQGKDEDKLTAEEDGDDYAILRVAFAFKPGEAVSVPWRAEYMPALEAIFGSGGTKIGWNSRLFDDPRIRAKFPMRGDLLDAMRAWHILNTALPKSLGFVTPYYAQRSSMWKHLAGDQPAFYNAKDADMALRCWQGIEKDLKANNLWEVYDRHNIKLGRVFTYMSDKGVALDAEMRAGAETKLAAILDDTEQRMEAAIPEAARKLKVFKKEPKDVTGLVQVDGLSKVSRCPRCFRVPAKADHFKSVGKKALKGGSEENPCLGLKPERVDVASKLWAKPLEFKISKVGLLGYQKALRHRAIIDRKLGRVTFDENAIMKLMKQHPKDPLYPLILEHRGTQKLLSNYVGVTQLDGTIRGGMPTGPDGRVRTSFTDNPSTLRSASQNPNLQNLPRPKGAEDLASIIRNLIMAAPGHIFTATDYSGIEAVLVGYFASSARYMRLAKLDVHSFYTAWALHELDGSVSSSDLPDHNWPDEKLIPHLAALKKRLKEQRNNLFKHLVHGANFMQGPKGAQQKILNETGIEYPLGTVAKVMDVYFNLFPEIKKWHQSVLLQAEKDGFIRNPFGYVHRFSRVFEYTRIGGKWEKEPGPEANKVIAFGPQSTAAGIIKEAMLRLYYDRFEEAGQWLRLLIHDELFFETPEDRVDAVDAVVQEEMGKPVPELRLPASFNMGECLGILTESKRGKRWGEMK